MEKVADDILEGLQCLFCGRYFTGRHGHEAVCSFCFDGLEDEEQIKYIRATKNVL